MWPCPALVHKKHLPTGDEDVKLAYVIYMLLDEWGVVARRADWREVLRPSAS